MLPFLPMAPLCHTLLPNLMYQIFFPLQNDAHTFLANIATNQTKDAAAVCRRADIVIVAVGRAEMVTSEWIKEGAVVVDVGINAVPERADPSKTKLVGDVHFEQVRLSFVS